MSSQMERGREIHGALKMLECAAALIKCAIDFFIEVAWIPRRANWARRRSINASASGSHRLGLCRHPVGEPRFQAR